MPRAVSYIGSPDFEILQEDDEIIFELDLKSSKHAPVTTTTTATSLKAREIPYEPNSLTAVASTLYASDSEFTCRVITASRPQSSSSGSRRGSIRWQYGRHPTRSYFLYPLTTADTSSLRK